MRRTLTWSLVAAGVAVMAVSYFLLAAPWGAASPDDSEPRMPFAAGLFVLGVVVAFLGAVVYEVLPGRRRR